MKFTEGHFVANENHNLQVVALTVNGEAFYTLADEMHMVMFSNDEFYPKVIKDALGLPEAKPCSNLGSLVGVATNALADSVGLITEPLEFKVGLSGDKPYLIDFTNKEIVRCHKDNLPQTIGDWNVVDVAEENWEYVLTSFCLQAINAILSDTTCGAKTKTCFASTIQRVLEFAVKEDIKVEFDIDSNKFTYSDNLLIADF